MKEAASSQPKPAKEELVEESDSSASHDKEAKCPPKTRERSPSAADSAGSDGKEQAPAQRASEPGADQEMKAEDEATPIKENLVSNSPRQAPANEATLEEEGQPGDTSPHGPVETPRDDETSSCYEPLRLQQGLAAEEGELRPRPDYAETMEFVVKMRKDVRPCHSRYHPELRVTYKNSGRAAGVTSTPLQVLGLGGSRVVAVAPHQENLVWKLSVCRLLGATTPTPVRAAGVHQMTEEGHNKPQTHVDRCGSRCLNVNEWAPFTIAMAPRSYG